MKTWLFMIFAAVTLSACSTHTGGFLVRLMVVLPEKLRNLFAGNG